MDRTPVTPAGDEARAARRIALAFGLSTLAGLGLGAVYLFGGQPQAEGVLLAVALGGIGYGLVEWAAHLMGDGRAVGDYAEVAPAGSEQDVVEEAGEGWDESFGRRTLLRRMLAAAGAALAAGLVFPIRSLGPSPGRSLFETSWKRGLRLVREDGTPVKAGEVGLDGVITVFPENHTGAQDSQALLIRVPAGAVKGKPGREDWAPDGHVAYSKICTHAGCPVGLYRAQSHDLFCPCHQSVFNVLEGAEPTAGPATRPLPQLPIEIDDQGYLVARGDFSAPVGPGFWNLP